MPGDSHSKSKSWSLRSMLGRKGTSKDRNEDEKKKKKRKAAKEEECGSIKERVLAKLKEPLPSELKKQAGRHSVDAFSPRLSRAYTDVSNVEAEEARHSVTSRYSTSSYGYSHADSDAASNCSYPYQASIHTPTPSSTCSTYRSMQPTCSSPTSNVIARLMGLGDSFDSGITTTRHVPLRAKLQTEASRSLWMQMQQDKAMRMSPGSNHDASRVTKLRQEKLARRDCGAQDFLDEMEDHLRQCDRALERIEAVMQLKKKLLYLNKRAGAAAATKPPSATARMNVCDYNRRSRELVPEQAVHGTLSSWCRNGVAHGRASSVDYLRGYDNETPTKPLKHRRSVSDGETPVFRPSNSSDFIELDVGRSMELHKESFKKWQTVQSEYPAARGRRPSTPHAPNISLDDSHIHRPTFESNSEQPSPVSVLDSSNIPDDSASEDDRDGHTENAGPFAKKKSVVRALWTTEQATSASSGANGVGKTTTTTATTTTTTTPTKTTGSDDAEVVKRMDVTWSSGMRAEIAELGLELEGMIFRRLVEETIIQVASVAGFRNPRKR